MRSLMRNDDMVRNDDARLGTQCGQTHEGDAEKDEEEEYEERRRRRKVLFKAKR
jgi:hypothetical protein